MTRPCGHRGAAPVGKLSDLAPTEIFAVLCLRSHGRGPEGRKDLAKTFARNIGVDAGDAALRAFGDVLDLCARYGRRPLMKHGLSCTCLGADEACFAHFIGAATDGEHEDAMFLATLMVRSDVAPMLAAIARDAGLALRRIAHRAAGAMHLSPHPETLH